MLALSVTIIAVACICMLLHFSAVIDNLERRVRELEKLQGEP